MKSSTLPALFLCGLSCATLLPLPTKENPVAMCEVSCCDSLLRRVPYLSNGGRNHVCPSSRLLRDITVVGEYLVRGADGAIQSAAWIAAEPFFESGSRQWQEIGLFPKSDVELGPCRAFQWNQIGARASSERGVHPGEDPLGQPLSPP